MSDDIVKRLRDASPATQDFAHTTQGDLMDEAADRIEALAADRENRLADLRIIKAERDWLRDALTRLLEPYGDDPCYYDHHGYCQAHFIEADCCVAYARAALKEIKP